MEYERASCCLSIPCPGAYPVTVLIAILPVPSLVSNVMQYLVSTLCTHANSEQNASDPCPAIDLSAVLGVRLLLHIGRHCRRAQLRRYPLYSILPRCCQGAVLPWCVLSVALLVYKRGACSSDSTPLLWPGPGHSILRLACR